MSGRGANVEFPAPDTERYAVAPTAVRTERGLAIRAARREHSMDVGAAARVLKMPVTDLIAVELGSVAFVDGNNYRRVIESLAQHAGHRKGRGA